MDDLAVENGLEIKVQGAGFRSANVLVENAVVPPSETSNHLVGHAVDINIVYNGVLYNSSSLRSYNALPHAIKNFITGCKRAGMRWGGDFSTPDPVHFDDNLYLRDKATYNRLYLLYQ
ncbi:MAG: M15 family metallopeptidase [Treponema sp.]|nr:M15 family metallopeptidase [Treponema sp.]